MAQSGESCTELSWWSCPPGGKDEDLACSGGTLSVNAELISSSPLRDVVPVVPLMYYFESVNRSHSIEFLNILIMQ